MCFVGRTKGCNSHPDSSLSIGQTLSPVGLLQFGYFIAAPSVKLEIKVTTLCRSTVRINQKGTFEKLSLTSFTTKGLLSCNKYLLILYLPMKRVGKPRCRAASFPIFHHQNAHTSHIFPGRFHS